MKTTLSIILVSLLFVNARAAIPKKILQVKQVKVTTADVKRVKEILNLPIENRILSLKKFDKSVSILKHLGQSEGEDLNVRWRSIAALGVLKERSALPLIEASLKSDKWFLRNVGLIAMSQLDRKKSLIWSKKLLTDEALVVRTAAVRNLKDVPTKYVRNTLWKSLYSPINYKNGESLWVRRHIAKALVSHAHTTDVPKFVKILHDKDQRLHPYAVRALEKLTKIRMGGKKAKFKDRRQLWLSWWDKQKSKRVTKL